ncbi:hypothetical protein F5X96DRAFT_669991 [Biscogniauxia mediterranea]|nr:hypothetical protein F5X96DRAFT_669991 [Biscogniauxia mediterranea]
MESPSGPYKPDDEERNYYYVGFTGNPRLVARTSDYHWSPPQRYAGWGNMEDQTRTIQLRKQYVAITDQEMISKWTKDVSYAIIKALERCNWCYFFPSTIRLESTCELLPTEAPQPTSWTVLLVAVQEDSLQWELGISIALECRDILRAFDISNVEVEIREGRYTHHAASAQLEARIDNELWGTETNKAILPMLSYPGYPIGYLEGRKSRGTIGLHLKLQGDDESTVYGLTCRHVVDNGRATHQPYKISGDYRQYHVQGDDNAFSECLEKTNRVQAGLIESAGFLERKKSHWDQWYVHDETKKHKCFTKEDHESLQFLRAQIAYNTSIIEHLKAVSEKEKRIIGHLAFHPSLEVSSQQPGYLRDWALIKLDPKKFIHNPQNEIFIDSPISAFLSHGRNIKFLTLHLKDELEQLNDYYQVGKRGGHTGMTFGTKSGIEAVVRHPTLDGKAFYTWELLVVPGPGYTNFSDKGDSGSCVFNGDGCVVGLVTSSSDAKPEHMWRGLPRGGSWRLVRYSGSNSQSEDENDTPHNEMPTWPIGTDVTFVAPIEWVLKDIRDFTGCQPILL